MSATFKINGGDEENRTPDPLLARQVLSQLSYAPILFLLALARHNFVSHALTAVDVRPMYYLPCELFASRSDA